MKRLLSVVLTLVILLGTFVNFRVSVNAGEYETRLLAHKKINEIIQNYCEPSYYIDNGFYDYLTESQSNELKKVAEFAINDCKTEYEKIEAVTKFVAENIYYDLDYFSGRTSHTFFDAYEVWVNKRTVCAGYAELIKILLKLIDIPCINVMGDNHEYNIAYDSDNERWIYLDATWCTGNEYLYGEYKKGAYNSWCFDMSLEFISELSNHEIYSLLFTKDEFLCYLQTSYNPDSWANVSEWYISLHNYSGNDEIIDYIPSDIYSIPVKKLFGFQGHENLKSVIVPDGITYIGGAFQGCKNLTDITIPDSVTTIAGSFQGCESLENITIPDSVTTITDYTFSGCKSLKSIVIPYGVTDLGNNTFESCENLEKITIPESLSNLGNNIFSNCVKLKDVKILNGITSIGEQAFYGCASLSSIIIPNSVKIIEKDAFLYCNNLENITMSKNVEKIGADAFLSTRWFSNQVDKADGVIYIGDFAYSYFTYSADKGIDLVIKNGTRGIADQAFAGERVKSIRLPDSLEYIGENALMLDYSKFKEKCVKKIIVPDSVKYIGSCGIGYYIDRIELGYCYGNPIPDFKIEGTSGSIAEQYAKENGLEFTITHPHAYVASVTAQPTCKKSGVKTYTCSCGDTYTEPISATGHKEVVIPAVAPTYTTVGKTEGKKCSVCGTVTVAQKDVAKLTLATPTVTQKNTAKGIEVNWNAIENAESYIVYRSVLSGSNWSKWSAIKKGVTGTSYVDGTVKLGTSYKYTVRAVNGSVMSGYQNTKDGLTYNVTPTVKVALVSNGIKVSWSTAANATGYTVYSSTYNTKTKKWSGWTNRGTVKANKTSWTDKSVKSGTQYKYTVRAVNGKVLSSYNKTGAATLYLAQPTVKIANNAKGVKVTWSKVTGATGYTVYRSEYKNGAWTKWASRGTAKANKTSWTDTKVTSGVQYKYTVRAINGKVASTYVSSNTVLYLAQPNVTVKAVSNGIKVAWTQSTGATGYTVYRMEYNAKTKKWSSWKNMGTEKPDKTNWTDKSAKKGVQYKYTVKAVNGNSASTYKSSSSVKR